MIPARSLIPYPASGALEEKVMKTKIVCALAMGLSMTASAAAAQDSDSITIASNVPKFCQSLTGLASAPLALGPLVDGIGQVVSAFSGDTGTNLTTYYCNGPATISLDANPLVRTPALAISDTGSFTNEVDYIASLYWSGIAISNASSAAAATVFPTTKATTGELTVSVSAPDTRGNLRPVAGDYEGSVVLNVNFN
jgi:hypothetical protein